MWMAIANILARHIVKTFNNVLQREVRASGFLCFLDFFDQLLSPDGEEFNKAYELDGTHMNPTYIPLLSAALNKAAERK